MDDKRRFYPTMHMDEKRRQTIWYFFSQINVYDFWEVIKEFSQRSGFDYQTAHDIFIDMAVDASNHDGECEP